ncbi:aliphatic sulfonate ABC transporter substrate-binding protein [Aquibacillus koreensis]|uniref:Putative aliphatic sulfonates-binding protein n=1 Tax=Aquibacillus koreensis TaxID=279446 RepID=A0A9X4AHW0_9BACI|nr:aliphatic sulfonate ABC transporter substrate-binding protein [Aquibacillus koreensis]MCT2536062.1 aliphatic sulfonate ABC transporter substrate-binding protein [Aquibacillus koreensis]MDC3420517.1 aliphatic sulfonate ABC transporter substrate-binding protein [Aquibacillus koreensis]
MKRIPLIDIRSFLTIVVLGLLLVVAAGCSTSGAEEGKPEEIRLDYAYYSPTSLVLKKFGWAEEAFAEEEIDVTWTLSQGSNKALEFLKSDSVDFGSSAGAAALMSKGTGAPIKNVYIYSKPEWTALVTNEGSGIASLEDLKGKKVAATLGTDPYIFLARSLAAEGISIDEIELVNLQHADGGSALTNGDVDAWAGLDPHMARLELEAGAELFYRNADFNTYGFLNVREAFAENHPEYVNKVIELYEKARNWIIENPEEAAELLAEEAGIDVEVAKKQLERNDFSNPVPGDTHIEALIAAGKVLQEGGDIKESVDVEQTTNDLIDPSFAEEVIGE